MAANHEGMGALVPQNLEWGDANANCPPCFSISRIRLLDITFTLQRNVMPTLAVMVIDDKLRILVSFTKTRHFKWKKSFIL